MINANRHLLKDDELVIVMAKLQPDRFSGGFRLSVNQVWDLATARCRFGKFLRVAVNGKAPDIKRLVRDFPPKREISEQGELVRGLGVRLSVKREAARGRAAAGGGGEVLSQRCGVGQLDGAGRPGRRPDRLRGVLAKTRSSLKIALAR